ncbi:MAG: type II methionyl aminopeptidase [Nitrososphaerota archaeon]
MLSEEDYRLLRTAGEIAKKVRSVVPALVREGVDALTIAQTVEDKIVEYGGRPAFPCNICVNSVAAHFTPTPVENIIIPSGALVKVDLGVECGGYIADTAVTVGLPNSQMKLIEAAENALRNAIKIVRSGIRASEIGNVINETVSQYGFKPIRNLSGHEIKKYSLHSGTSIPNVKTKETTKLEYGKIYAIEPFVTLGTGSGLVVSSSTVNIFSIQMEYLDEERLSHDELNLLRELKTSTRGLPYTLRWIEREKWQLHEKLVKRGVIKGYPVLVEKVGAPVAQAEHTIIVLEEGCEVVT